VGKIIEVDPVVSLRASTLIAVFLAGHLERHLVVLELIHIATMKVLLIIVVLAELGVKL